MSKQASMFHKEKRILAVFPYFAIVTVLIILTILSFLPRKVTRRVLESALSRAMIGAVMQSKRKLW
jgi:hypothetical protein